MIMKDFYTRESANEGVKLPLFTPEGKETEHYLVIRGVDSDAFRLAESEAKRSSIKIIGVEDEGERNNLVYEGKIEMLSSLICGWSFEEKVSKENIKTLLREAPQIADRIDRFACDRTLFFGLKSAGSESSPKTTSGSRKRRKAQPSPKETT